VDNTIKAFAFLACLSSRRRRAYLQEKELVPRTPPPRAGGREGSAAESAGRCFSHSDLPSGPPTFTAAPQISLNQPTTQRVSSLANPYILEMRFMLSSKIKVAGG
jgi:hypothetical protein